MKPVKNISKAELDSILCAADKRNQGDKLQRIRLIKLLAEKPGAITSEIRDTALIGNISDVANQANDLIEQTGFFIASEVGKVIKDRFGSNHLLFHWSLYRTIPSPASLQARTKTARRAF